MHRLLMLAALVFAPASALAVRSSSPNLSAGQVVIYTVRDEQFSLPFALPADWAYPPTEHFPAEIWEDGRWQLWGHVRCRVEWRGGNRRLVVSTDGPYEHGEGRCAVPTRGGSPRDFDLYIRWDL